MPRISPIAAPLTALALGVSLAAQQPSFEAASVKRNRTNGIGGPPVVSVSGTRVSAPFVTAREIIRVAYGVNENQVVGGPDWLTADRFELSAASPAGASLDDVRAMLQALLADRFGLVAHAETRDLPAYVLTFTGTFGPGMREAGSVCVLPSPPAGINVPPPPPPPPAGASALIVLGQPPAPKCALMVLRGQVSARDIAMDAFSALLVRELQRPVIDRTMLTGRYDIDLSYLPDNGPMTVNGVAVNPDAPSVATAVREQLGLKLESTRAPVEVIVVDRITPPTEN